MFTNITDDRPPRCAQISAARVQSLSINWVNFQQRVAFLLPDENAVSTSGRRALSPAPSCPPLPPLILLVLLADDRIYHCT